MLMIPSVAGLTFKGYDHGGKKESSSNALRMFTFTTITTIFIGERLMKDRAATTISPHSKKKETTLPSLVQQLYGSLLVHDHQSKDEREILKRCIDIIA
mmetsp:Transcript_61186/g.149812  ORF Transcript_61186/g.149812 Transcript_61186/m.149812 type:complete len:99 (-) Transcript_61186:983-1279(-)